MKAIDILNDEKYSFFAKQFRQQCKQQYPATEIALINRYLNGEITLHPDIDFSDSNLKLIESLQIKG